MMDGLALGETTPGPLIMIVTWVGYMGGVTKSVLGDPIAAGLAGATVATFFTFLPSFWFIIAGGPMIESTRGELKFTAPLTAISAAVVGVILNLAAFFAWHTFWPQGTKATPFAAPSSGCRWSSPSPLHRLVEIQGRHHEGDRSLRSAWAGVVVHPLRKPR
jgi:chromate transporter